MLSQKPMEKNSLGKKASIKMMVKNRVCIEIISKPLS